MREAQAQRASLHHVPATLLAAAPTWNADANGEGAAPGVDARWRAPDGQVRTGEVFVLVGAAAGSTVLVWTNQAGQLADPPLGPSQLAGRAELADAAAVGCPRRRPDRGGLAGPQVPGSPQAGRLGRGWLATGPHWSPRR